jgi:hypothetical protein
MPGLNALAYFVSLPTKKKKKVLSHFHLDSLFVLRRRSSVGQTFWKPRGHLGVPVWLGHLRNGLVVVVVGVLSLVTFFFEIGLFRFNSY